MQNVAQTTTNRMATRGRKLPTTTTELHSTRRSKDTDKVVVVPTALPRIVSPEPPLPQRKEYEMAARHASTGNTEKAAKLPRNVWDFIEAHPGLAAQLLSAKKEEVARQIIAAHEAKIRRREERERSKMAEKSRGVLRGISVRKASIEKKIVDLQKIACGGDSHKDLQKDLREDEPVGRSGKERSERLGSTHETSSRTQRRRQSARIGEAAAPRRTNMDAVRTNKTDKKDLQKDGQKDKQDDQQKRVEKEAQDGHRSDPDKDSPQNENILIQRASRDPQAVRRMAEGSADWLDSVRSFLAAECDLYAAEKNQILSAALDLRETIDALAQIFNSFAELMKTMD